MSTVTGSTTTTTVTPSEITVPDIATTTTAASSERAERAASPSIEADDPSDIASVNSRDLALSLDAKTRQTASETLEKLLSKDIVKSMPPRPSSWKFMATAAYDKNMQALQAAAKECEATASRLSEAKLGDLQEQIRNPAAGSPRSAIEDYMAAQSKFQDTLKSAMKALGQEQNPVLADFLRTSEFRLSESMALYVHLNSKADGLSANESSMTFAEGLGVLAKEMHGHDKANEQIVQDSRKFLTDLEGLVQRTPPSELKSLIGSVSEFIDSIDRKLGEISGNKPQTIEREEFDTSVKLYASDFNTEELEALRDEFKAKINTLLAFEAKTDLSQFIASKIRASLPDLPTSAFELRLPTYPLSKLKPEFAGLSEDELEDLIDDNTYTPEKIYELSAFELSFVTSALMKYEAATRYLKTEDMLLGMLDRGEITPESLIANPKDTEQPLVVKLLTQAHQDLDFLDRAPDPALTVGAIISDARKIVNSKIDFSDYLATASTEEISPLAIIEAKLRGIPAEHVLGAEFTFETTGENRGGVNRVKFLSLTTSAGESEEVVFKAEAKAQEQLVGQFGTPGYSADTQVINVNIASGIVASAIACADTISETRFAVVDGVFGMAMAKAKGVPVSDLHSDDKNFTITLEDGSEAKVSFSDLVTHLKDKGLYQTMQQNLMRELSKLEWADALSGQFDRHTGNYLIDINEEGKVKITGIDNDLSFSTVRTGMYSLSFTHASLIGSSSIPAEYRGKTLTFAPSNPENPSRDGELIDPKVLVKGKDFSFASTFSEGFGANTVRVPTHIPRDVYNALMSIDETEYRASLEKLLSKDELEAAMLRLADAKIHARELFSLDRVVEDWSKVDLTLLRPIENGASKELETFSASFFVADFLSPFRSAPALL